MLLLKCLDAVLFHATGFAPLQTQAKNGIDKSVIVSSMLSSLPKISHRPLHNRISAVLAHIPRYAFQGETRLAHDSGISKSALCRFMSGQSSPSFALVDAVTGAIEKQTGKHMDPRELVSRDGTYPTAWVCDLMGCKGCLPDQAYDAQDGLKPEYDSIRPGRWNGSVMPRQRRAPGQEAR